MSCVARAHLVFRDPGPAVEAPVEVRLDQPVPLRLADRRGGTLLFDAHFAVAVTLGLSIGTAPGFVSSTQTYEYRLLDRLERELLVYHWQPGPRYAGPDHPHLHVSASLRAMTSAADEREIDLDKLHLPTGQVTLAAVVRSLITEFGVEPIRPDWARVLDEVGELATSNQAD